MKAMRILQIHPYLRCDRVNPRAGGKTRTSLMLTQYLATHGHEVGVYAWPEQIWQDAVPFTPDGRTSVLAFPTMALPAFPAGLVDAVRTARIRFPDREKRSFPADFCFYLGLRAALNKFKPDLIHCHQTVSDIPALLNALRPGVPAVLSHHHGESGPGLAVYDRVLFPCRTLMEEINRDAKLPVARIDTVYNPVADVFRQGEVPPEDSREGLVFIGGITEAKGVDLLMEAYAGNPALRKVPLRLCGTGPDAARFREAAETNGLPWRFEGKLDRESVKTILSGARLLVNPSRLEGFSVALLEAIACGTPVVGWAPQVREMETVWERRVGSGFAPHAQSPADLAGIILAALDDPLQRTAARKDGAAWARSTFSLDRYGEAMLRQYALARGKAG